MLAKYPTAVTPNCMRNVMVLLQAENVPTLTPVPVSTGVVKGLSAIV
jgi:hypothetical protein